jgi:hypothetical protein
MTLLVIRDVPRSSWALIVNGERIAEFRTPAAAWEYAEHAFGITESRSTSHDGHREVRHLRPADQS